MDVFVAHNPSFLIKKKSDCYKSIISNDFKQPDKLHTEGSDFRDKLRHVLKITKANIRTPSCVKRRGQINLPDI